jgi:hypothetical protein
MLGGCITRSSDNVMPKNRSEFLMMSCLKIDRAVNVGDQGDDVILRDKLRGFFHRGSFYDAINHRGFPDI